MEKYITNVLEKFCEDVFLYLTGKSKPDNSLLVKKHTENLHQHGDFSFPNCVRSWHEYLDAADNLAVNDDNLLKRVNKKVDEMPEISKNWSLKVSKVKEDRGRIHLCLDKYSSICIGFRDSLSNTAMITEKLKDDVNIALSDPLCIDSNCITSLRIQYLTKTVNKLLLATYNTDRSLPSIVVTSKSTSRHHNNSLIVLCGTVINFKTGLKETSLTAPDFIRLRQDEMTLVAQHKYGVRVSTDNKWKEYINHLGESAAKFELLQAKPGSAVKIDFGSSSVGCSKGAAFILYNCARLETIIRTFEDKVAEGIYPPLPDIEDADLSLLTQEDEWSLIFNYIMGLPSLLKNSVVLNNNLCEFRPHQVCSFLSSLVRVFSQYYRRTRILTEHCSSSAGSANVQLQLLVELVPWKFSPEDFRTQKTSSASNVRQNTHDQNIKQYIKNMFKNTRH